MDDVDLQRNIWFDFKSSEFFVIQGEDTKKKIIFLYYFELFAFFLSWFVWECHGLEHGIINIEELRCNSLIGKWVFSSIQSLKAKFP